jgi:hypothetical protein
LNPLDDANQKGLDSLLHVLRKHGVRQFSCPGFSVDFTERAALANPIVENSPEKLETTSKRVEETSDEDLYFSS